MAISGVGRALASGLAGAAALTAVHETARRSVAHAPRMDVIGMRALRGVLERMGRRPLRGQRLFRATLAGDLLGNTLYYSLVGLGNSRHAWRRGVGLGLAAGLGGALLPQRLGLGRSPGARRPVTPLMTVGWYLLGGLAAAGAMRAFAPASRPPAR